MQEWIAKALELGFDHAAEVKVENLVPQESVRDACMVDKCHSYDKNWGCPPGVGTLEECGKKMQEYDHAILLQSVGVMEDSFDFECVEETAKRHTEQIFKFAEVLREAHPGALCLGAGPCTVCPTCAYPEPCRLPDKAISSMEAYGLFVTDVTKTTDLQYYYGKGTITYVACCLF